MHGRRGSQLLESDMHMDKAERSLLPCKPLRSLPRYNTGEQSSLRHLQQSRRHDPYTFDLSIQR